MHMELINNTFIPEKEIPRSLSIRRQRQMCIRDRYGTDK